MSAGFFPVAQDHDAGGRRLALPPGVQSEAKYGGPNNCYRYWLQRIWPWHDPKAKLLFWIMLNPSTATEYCDDATLAKCRRLSARWGFRGMVICNLSPYRCTDSKVLHLVEQPLFPPNNLLVIETVLRSKALAEPVVLGWGSPRIKELRRQMLPQTVALAKLLGGRGRTMKLSVDGHPNHPLYCPEGGAFQDLPRWPPK